MLNLNSLSQSNADVFRNLDRADGAKDNKVVIKGLSAEDKTKLKGALEGLLKENETHAVLSPVDVEKINAALINLNSNGKSPKGAAYVEFKDNLKFPEPAKKAKEAPAVAAPVKVADVPAPPTAEETAAKEKQSELTKDFRKGKIIYSQNLGLLDKHHIAHNSVAFIQAYNAALEAVRTGKPQEIELEYGSSFHKHIMTYKVEAKEGDDLLKIARQIVANASYKYEEKSVVLGGLANQVAEKVGMGTSAFSTEDLSSNAIGIHAAEQYIRSQAPDPNHPPKDFADKMAKVTPPPRTNDEGDKVADNAIDWALRHGGTLYSQQDAGVKPELFGNRSFSPVKSTGSNVKGADSKEGAFFDSLDKEKPQSMASGTGWAYVPPKPPAVNPYYPKY
jgi:hypothetical protein